MTDEEFNKRYNMDKMKEDYDSYLKGIKELVDHVKTLSPEEKKELYEDKDFNRMLESSELCNAEIDRLVDNLEKIKNKD